MKPLSQPFRSRNTEDTTVDMRLINELIDQIDEAIKKIFYSNASKLLNEPITNVVTAVWGTNSCKMEPTSAQRQIDHIIRPLMGRIQDDLEREKLSEAKNIIIDTLIKRLVIWEIGFMIKCYKLSLLTAEQSESDTYNLADTEVVGHA
jgi:hypothetical protein